MICATRVRNKAAVAETAAESSTAYDVEERDREQTTVRDVDAAMEGVRTTRQGNEITHVECGRNPRS